MSEEAPVHAGIADRLLRGGVGRADGELEAPRLGIAQRAVHPGARAGLESLDGLGQLDVGVVQEGLVLRVRREPLPPAR